MPFTNGVGAVVLDLGGDYVPGRLGISQAELNNMLGWVEQLGEVNTETRGK